MVKNPPKMQETWVQCLGREDPLEEGMTTHSIQYACLENPHGKSSLEGYSPWGCKELDTTEQLSMHARANNNKNFCKPSAAHGSSICSSEWKVQEN